MNGKKVIISEEMFKRQPQIELEINNKLMSFNNSIPKKVSEYQSQQNFSLERDTILTLKRIK